MKDPTPLIPGKRAQGTLLRLVVDLNADIHLAITMLSSTLVSTNLGSGVVTTICGLRCNMVWRSLASSAGYGPVSMVIVIVVGMLVDTALLAGTSCSFCLADYLGL